MSCTINDYPVRTGLEGWLKIYYLPGLYLFVSLLFQFVVLSVLLSSTFLCISSTCWRFYSSWFCLDLWPMFIHQLYRIVKYNSLFQEYCGIGSKSPLLETCIVIIPFSQSHWFCKIISIGLYNSAC